MVGLRASVRYKVLCTNRHLLQKLWKFIDIDVKIGEQYCWHCQLRGAHAHGDWGLTKPINTIHTSIPAFLYTANKYFWAWPISQLPVTNLHILKWWSREYLNCVQINVHFHGLDGLFTSRQSGDNCPMVSKVPPLFRHLRGKVPTHSRPGLSICSSVWCSDARLQTFTDCLRGNLEPCLFWFLLINK